MTIRQITALVFLTWVGLAASPVLAEDATPVSRSFAIVLENASGSAPAGRLDVQVRVFEGENPDAPPQVSNITVHAVSVEAASWPMRVAVPVSEARLSAALHPYVSALVLSEGRMLLWDAEAVPLAPAGETTVKLIPVP
jgi:hypothetical protein